MAVNCRQALIGAAVSALSNFAPSFAAFAQAAGLRESGSAQASFRLRRRTQALDYAYCDPWLVRVANGVPKSLIHEASGALFARRPSGELEAQGAWIGYKPPYPRIALIEDEDGLPRLQALSSDLSGGDLSNGDAKDRENLLLAARQVDALCMNDAQRQGDGFLKVRPASTRYGEVRISPAPASGYAALPDGSFPQELSWRAA